MKGRWEYRLSRNETPAACTPPLRHLESIHARKTGAMIRVSLRLGAMTANASAEQLRALDEYGRRFGLAFQVTDDLLDVRGSDEGWASGLARTLGRARSPTRL